jgi:hypothetical protein
MKKVEWSKDPAGLSMITRLHELSLRIARIDLAQRAQRNLAMLKALTEKD